jgi:hypothetical protein
METDRKELYDELKKLFLTANQVFLANDADLITSGVSERGLCAALMCHLKDKINESQFRDYYVDVEYNRNDGEVKTIMNNKMKIIPVTCDLIVHSRGKNVEQDNLLALEMKRSTHSEEEKVKDKERLKCLTRDSFNNIWGWNGTLPEHVCRYVIGIYYEIDIANRAIKILYYRQGERMKPSKINF